MRKYNSYTWRARSCDTEVAISTELTMVTLCIMCAGTDARLWFTWDITCAMAVALTRHARYEGTTIDHFTLVARRTFLTELALQKEKDELIGDIRGV